MISKSLISLQRISGRPHGGRKSRADKLKGIDVEKEYALIQENKSELPAELRNLIIFTRNSKSCQSEKETENIGDKINVDSRRF